MPMTSTITERSARFPTIPMPEETEAAPEEAVREPKVRRISNKIPRQKNKEEPARKDLAAEPSPEPDDAPQPDKKRSNRRRRGKGKSGQKESELLPAEEPASEETISLVPEPPEPRPERKDKPESTVEPRESRHQPHKPRHKPDPEKVAKNAWKIFLAEVSEEGVALIGDNDARELARRCFRLSEIFLEEEDRRS
jgi:hypothetical protein